MEGAMRARGPRDLRNIVTTCSAVTFMANGEQRVRRRTRDILRDTCKLRSFKLYLRL